MEYYYIISYSIYPKCQYLDDVPGDSSPGDFILGPQGRLTQNVRLFGGIMLKHCEN